MNTKSKRCGLTLLLISMCLFIFCPKSKVLSSVSKVDNMKMTVEDEMLNRLEIYKCNKCGIITKILESGEGALVCCDAPMIRMVENMIDAAEEKHVPIVEKLKGGIKVSVGSVSHPMDEDHYIQWIEIVSDSKSLIKFLSSDDAPEAIFYLDCDKFSVRAYCNLHGLWKN